MTAKTAGIAARSASLRAGLPRRRAKSARAGDPGLRREEGVPGFLFTALKGRSSTKAALRAPCGGKEEPFWFSRV